MTTAELYGPIEGLAALEAIDTNLVENYQPYHAAGADLLARAGDGDEAVRAYDRAIDLTSNTIEQHFLHQRRAAFAKGGGR